MRIYFIALVKVALRPSAESFQAGFNSLDVIRCLFYRPRCARDAIELEFMLRKVSACVESQSAITHRKWIERNSFSSPYLSLYSLITRLQLNARMHLATLSTHKDRKYFYGFDLSASIQHRMGSRGVELSAWIKLRLELESLIRLQTRNRP